MSDDVLLHEGQVITTRSDCQELIKQYVKEHGLTEDDAWSRVKSELVRHLTDRQAQAPKSSGKGGASKYSAPRTPTKPQPTGTEVPGAINGNEIENLSEDILPPELKREGISVMDAIAAGKIKLNGEHPYAKLLARTAPRTSGLPPEQAAPLEEDAKKAMQQLEMDFPAIQYPMARSSIRVMPSDINRTSLFHVGSNNLPRRFCKNEKLGRIGNGSTIHYQGEELRQNDEAVFRQLIHIARGKKPWEWIYLKECSFIKEAKGTSRHLSAKDFNELHDIVMRLRAGLLFIQSKRRGGFITCNLFAQYEGVGNDQRIMLDPRIVLLFDSYAALDENIIDALTGVAQKLYNYIQTIPHTGLHPILISNLFELCYGRREYLIKEYKKQLSGKAKAKNSSEPKAKSGADDNEMSIQKRAELAIAKKYSDFHRKSLPNALDELKAKDLIIDYTINRKDEKVSIIKNPQAVTAMIQEVPSDNLEV